MASNLGNHSLNVSKKTNIDDCFDEIQKTIKDFDEISIKENGLETTAKSPIHELLDQSRDTHTVKQKKPLESSNLNEETSGIFLPKSTRPDMQSQVFKDKPPVTNSTYVRPDMQQSTSSNQKGLNTGDKPPPRRDGSTRYKIFLTTEMQLLIPNSFIYLEGFII